LSDKDLRTTLSETLTGRTAFVGIGNVDLSDDAFGVRLAEKLSSAGLSDILITDTMPENHIGTLAQGGFDNVVFLDAVSTGAQPGSVVFLDASEVKNRFPQISTHKLALGALARLIEAESPSRVWLLGTQPATLKQGNGLSEAVETTLNLLRILLLDILQRRKMAEGECTVS
jgi:hydrogenase maturation protease